MDDFTQMHIFFVITSIAAIIFTVLLLVMGIFLAKILSDIRYITKKAKHEADLISEDLSDLREKVQSGMKFKYVWGFLSNLYKRHKK